MDKTVLEIEIDFIEAIKYYWLDIGKILRKMKRRRLYLRRYHRRGERMAKWKR